MLILILNCVCSYFNIQKAIKQGTHPAFRVFLIVLVLCSFIFDYVWIANVLLGGLFWAESRMPG